MTSLRERVAAELEAIDRVLSELPANASASSLSALERAGVAALLHSFYNGLENLLRLMVRARGLQVPAGDSWHRDLVGLAVTEGLIRADTAQGLRPYLAFRHFFAHAYAIYLQLDRLEPLVRNAQRVYAWFREDVDRVLAASP
jgi:uncharacterized protein YutE (UPF0331/DUF86 family)